MKRQKIAAVGFRRKVKVFLVQGARGNVGVRAEDSSGRGNKSKTFWCEDWMKVQFDQVTQIKMDSDTKPARLTLVNSAEKQWYVEIKSSEHKLLRP